MAIQLKGNATSTYSDSATFGGDITFTPPTGVGGIGSRILWTTESPFLDEVASIDSSRSSDSNAATDLVFNTGGGTTGAISETLRLAADGTATFAGAVICLGDPNGGATNGTRLGSTVQCGAPTSAGTVWAGYVVGTTDPTSTIKADGSATFGGNGLYGRDFDNVFCRTGNSTNAPGIDINIDKTAPGYSDSSVAFRIRTWDGTTNETAKVFIDNTGKMTLPGSLASSGTQNVSANAGGRLVLGTSDRRLKEDITPLSGMLDKVKGLNPVSYKWIDKENSGAGTNLGFIAQEVEEVFPEVTYETVEGMKGLNYPGLISPLTKALQEAITRIEALEAQLTQLTGGAN